MRKALRISWIFAIAALLMWGCAEDEEPDFEVRQQYLGQWAANDREGWNAPAFYDITITAGEADDEIIINGLYNIPEVSLRAYIDGTEVTIPSQTSAEIEFGGSGQANVDFDQVTFDYTANDGSGSDEVKTVCKRP